MCTGPELADFSPPWSQVLIYEKEVRKQMCNLIADESMTMAAALKRHGKTPA